MSDRDHLVNRLAVAWERWDAQCLRRGEPGGSMLPNPETHKRMVDAVYDLGAHLGVTGTAMWVTLAANMKAGTSHRGAVALAIQTLDTAP